VTLAGGATKALAFGCAVSAAIPIGVARADTPPSTWDLVKDPSLRQTWALHEQVESLGPEGVSGSDPLEVQAGNELRLEGARAALEASGAAKSRDVRLVFDLGHVYEELANIQNRNDLHQKVVDTLAPVLADPGDTPAVTQALEDLVFAYAKLDRPRDELAVWKELVPRALDDRARVAPLMNMGEAEMRLGDLDEAIATFRDALRKCERLPNSSGVNSNYALLMWDLAVALDRSGDPASALGFADKARRFVVGLRRDRTGTARPVDGWDLINDDPDVFFVPEWEREWYLALGDSADAMAESDPKQASRAWADAERHWDTYFKEAAQEEQDEKEERADAGKRPTSRWAGLARKRRDHARLQRIATDAVTHAVPARPLRVVSP
jgi:tetratricopeptide (TPR) repeat protein